MDLLDTRSLSQEAVSGTQDDKFGGPISESSGSGGQSEQPLSSSKEEGSSNNAERTPRVLPNGLHDPLEEVARFLADPNSNETGYKLVFLQPRGPRAPLPGTNIYTTPSPEDAAGRMTLELALKSICEPTTLYPGTYVVLLPYIYTNR